MVKSLFKIYHPLILEHITSTRNILLLSIIIIVIGCTNINQSQYQTKLPFTIPSVYQTSLNIKNRCSLTSWYKTFNDNKLNKLIDRVVKRNIDLKIAKKTLEELKYEILKTNSKSYPSINLETTFSRQRQNYKTQDFYGRERYIKNLYSSYSGKIVASYEIDLWKKISFEKNITRLEYSKSKENREILMESIISNAIKLYFQISAIEKKIKLYNKKNQILTRLYNIYRKKYKKGLVDYLQVKYYYNSMIDNNILLNDILKQKESLEQKLNTLSCNYPTTNNIEVSEFNININKLKIPYLVPSDLLKRRPDIKKAMLDVKESLSKLGYAHSIRFPSINLSAYIGYYSNKLNEFIDPTSNIWAISTSILYNIFNRGKLKLNEKQKEQSVYKSILNYQNVVLNAFFEVENTLLERKILEKDYRYYLTKLNTKKQEYLFQKQRYSRGIVGITQLYQKELDLINLKEKIIDLSLSIINNQILLFKVLGGTYSK